MSPTCCLPDARATFSSRTTDSDHGLGPISARFPQPRSQVCLLFNVSWVIRIGEASHPRSVLSLPQITTLSQAPQVGAHMDLTRSASVKRSLSSMANMSKPTLKGSAVAGQPEVSGLPIVLLNIRAAAHVAVPCAKPAPASRLVTETSPLAWKKSLLPRSVSVRTYLWLLKKLGHGACWSHQDARGMGGLHGLRQICAPSRSQH